METQREKASARIKKRWDASNKPKEDIARKLKIRASLFSVIISTQGWRVLLDSFEASIETLIQDLYKTSPFRVLKCMQIRSEIKAYKKIYGLMKSEEGAHGLAKLLKN